MAIFVSRREVGGVILPVSELYCGVPSARVALVAGYVVVTVL